MDSKAIENGDKTSFLVEDQHRLSASLLWRLQRKFFSEQSIEAWRQNIVPHYITSNTFIAQAYARLVFGYLRDLASDTRHPLDAAQPVYVLELGAGSGRFSYHFLKKFFAIWQQSSLAHIAVTYVMSDFCEQNLTFWRQHPLLQSYIEQGCLDFALVDASAPQDIVLQHCGATLSGATLKNPLVTIANYVFDSIEQDAFYVDGGVLHESLVSLHSPQPEHDLADVTLLQRLQPRYAHVPATSVYYPEPELNQLLAYYQAHLVDSHVLLPVQMLRCLAHLRHISGNRMLLITGDKGYSREEQLLFRREAHIVKHGSVSLMVNYHALAQYTAGQGGLFLAAPQRRQDLYICASVFDVEPLEQSGLRARRFVETRQAFNEHINCLSPDDFYQFKKFIQENAQSLTLRQLLSYLRLSGWDAANFWACLPSLMQLAETLAGEDTRDVAEMVEQVWDNYFPLGEERDLAYVLAGLLYEIECYPEAICYLQHSRRLYGDDAGTLYNLSMCHYNLRQLPQALDYIHQALSLDAGYEPARIMLIAISSER